MATNACATSHGEVDQSAVQPTIEILALSRGRGVPEATGNTLQTIAAAADSALKSGLVVSIRRETIGLEGETRLCIVFRDRSASIKVGDEFRKLAAGVDLLQVNENGCSGK